MDVLKRGVEFDNDVKIDLITAALPPHSIPDPQMELVGFSGGKADLNEFYLWSDGSRCFIA
jgi:hypothetical protein